MVTAVDPDHHREVFGLTRRKDVEGEAIFALLEGSPFHSEEQQLGFDRTQSEAVDHRPEKLVVTAALPRNR